MPGKRGGNVKDKKRYEGLRDEGMSKERAAKIGNTPRKNASQKAAATRKKRAA